MFILMNSLLKINKMLIKLTLYVGTHPYHPCIFGHVLNILNIELEQVFFFLLLVALKSKLCTLVRIHILADLISVCIFTHIRNYLKIEVCYK